MEKRVSHYKLMLVKKLIGEFKYNITNKAVQNAQNDFNIKSKDIISYILQLEPINFYKSMTSEYNHKIWQDVYHLQIKKFFAYIKIQIIDNESIIIQFKRK